MWVDAIRSGFSPTFSSLLQRLGERGHNPTRGFGCLGWHAAGFRFRFEQPDFACPGPTRSNLQPAPFGIPERDRSEWNGD
jgi:hypothetical protein